MGRGKVNMEFIRNPKSRNSTFKKRKEGLMKKTYELATLCGVAACTIVFGPNDGDHRPSTWPQDHEEIRQIINVYQSIAQPGKKSLNLSDFFEERTKKVEAQIERTRHGNDEAKSSGWDAYIKNLKTDELVQLMGSLDTKLDFINSRVESLKQNTRHNDTSHSLQQQGLYYQNLINNIDSSFSALHPQPSFVKPLHMYNHSEHGFSHLFNSDLTSSMTMLLNDTERKPFASTSTDSSSYDPPMGPLLYHDPMEVVAPEQDVRQMLAYYGTAPVMPLMQPQYEERGSQLASSQAPLMMPYYDFSDFQMNIRKANY